MWPKIVLEILLLTTTATNKNFMFRNIFVLLKTFLRMFFKITHLIQRFVLVAGSFWSRSFAVSTFDHADGQQHNWFLVLPRYVPLILNVNFWSFLGPRRIYPNISVQFLFQSSKTLSIFGGKAIVARTAGLWCVNSRSAVGRNSKKCTEKASITVR